MAICVHSLTCRMNYGTNIQMETEMRAACSKPQTHPHARVRNVGETWPSDLLFSCTLATKPVSGICGVSWGMGGGGGAIDTEHHPSQNTSTQQTQRGKRESRKREKKKKNISPTWKWWGSCNLIETEILIDIERVKWHSLWWSDHKHQQGSHNFSLLF